MYDFVTSVGKVGESCHAMGLVVVSLPQGRRLPLFICPGNIPISIYEVVTLICPVSIISMVIGQWARLGRQFTDLQSPRPAHRGPMYRARFWEQEISMSGNRPCEMTCFNERPSCSIDMMDGTRKHMLSTSKPMTTNRTNKPRVCF